VNNDHFVHFLLSTTRDWLCSSIRFRLYYLACLNFSAELFVFVIFFTFSFVFVQLSFICRLSSRSLRNHYLTLLLFNMRSALSRNRTKSPQSRGDTMFSNIQINWVRDFFENDRMRDMCSDQDTSHDVKKNWSKEVNRAFSRKSEIWFHFNDWDLQWSQLNQSLQKFSYRYEVCLHSCSKEWRSFNDSRILENNQEQIQSNRSNFSHKRRKNAWTRFSELFISLEIITKRSTLYKFSQNEQIERSEKIIILRARTMRITAYLLINLWSNIMKTVDYLNNRTSKRKLQWKTSFEILIDQRSKLSHLHSYEYRAYALKILISRKEKLESRTFIDHLVN
jgi:hypothetical protein